MTDHEISFLLLGINLGVLLMVLLNIVFDRIEARRDKRAVKGPLTQQAKRDATRNWRDALTVRERV